VTSVHLERVRFSYPASTGILDNVDLHLGCGWTGVVGANGSGKTTLLSLIAGELEPTAGSVRIDPSSSRPVLCQQEVSEPNDQLRSFADSVEGPARRWMGRLELDRDGLGRWQALSPGERKRWQIAAALARNPRVLLLDEPTNHLDPLGRRVLTDALERFTGVGLVVSHDRDLLNRLTCRTIRVRDASVSLWHAAYDDAKAGWEAEDRERVLARDRLAREHKKLKRWLADQRRAAETRSARHRRSLRGAGKSDTDARSMAARGRAAAGSATAARQMQVNKSALERLAGQLISFENRKELGRTLFFDYEHPRRRILLAYEGELRVPARVLVPHLSVQLRRADRIRLVGANGAGKTTLLAALAAGSTLPEDRLLFLPQELRRRDIAAAYDRLSRLPRERKGRVLTLVAALGVDPDRLLSTDRPSPGEARKLVMAFGLALSAWCLVFDEPTNHLDLPSVERLETAIAGFPGAVLIVSHDEKFVQRTTESEWRIDAGALVSRG
jgi:ATPase subunit of ABC transporter with duplicated ATPase domains